MGMDADEFEKFCDSDDSDIFELVRIKPMPGLTKQRAFEITENVLKKEFPQGSPDELEESGNPEWADPSTEIQRRKRKHPPEDEDEDIVILSDNLQPKKDPSVNEVTPKKTESNVKSTLITKYYSPVKCSPVKENQISIQPNCETEEKVHLSPRTKRLKVENISPEKNSDVDDTVHISNAKKIPESSYFYCQSLKKIIHHVLTNQKFLKQNSVKEGKVFSYLFLKEECECFNKFFQMSDKACKLYARMLCRKKCWHRMTKISYPDISDKIEDVFVILEKNNFIDFDIGKESLEAQLDLLKKAEIQKLCKLFNITTSGGGTKKDSIDAIVRSTRSQRSVIDMWKRNNESTRLLSLKMEVLQILGTCVKLNESTLSSFNRLILLFSLTHSVENDERWCSQINMMTQVNRGLISYPSYTVQPTVLFELRDDFISYEKADSLIAEFKLAVSGKCFKDAYSIGQTAKRKFTKAVENEGFRRRVMELPKFLRRYNAGSVYAKILTMYCENFKRNKDPEEIIEIMNTLLNQNVFLASKRGLWYDLLAQAYASRKNLRDAAKTLIRALKEDGISEVDRLKLQTRGTSVLKKSSKGLKPGNETLELEKLCKNGITEPSSVEVKAKALAGNTPGNKCVYVKESGGERIYSSVEEYAINYYKQNGFTEGIHSEGSIIQTIFFLLFFDIIYGNSPAGVFQTPYQEFPLDFFSECFYQNRKDAIDVRLNEMRGWPMDSIQEKITRVYTENFGVSSIVTWKESLNPEMFCDIIRCLGVDKLTSICERLVQNFKVYGSGFPDLTVWNPVNGKCKFVEVKSPNDKLSVKQRIWLDFLRKLGVDCEVCNVKNTASKVRTS